MRIPALKLLIAAVADALDPEAVPKTKRNWTSHIAHRLAEFARAKGFVPYGKQFSPDHPEYLCDQVWGIEDDETWSSYRGLALAMECEWNSSEDDLLLDFCKLLDVSAARRVFIGNLGTRIGWPDARRRAFLDELCFIVKHHRYFSGTDEVVVFLCEQGGREEVDCWILTGDGRRRPGQ